MPHLQAGYLAFSLNQAAIQSLRKEGGKAAANVMLILKSISCRIRPNRPMTWAVFAFLSREMFSSQSSRLQFPTRQMQAFAKANGQHGVQTPQNFHLSTSSWEVLGVYVVLGIMSSAQKAWVGMKGSCYLGPHFVAREIWGSKRLCALHGVILSLWEGRSQHATPQTYSKNGFLSCPSVGIILALPPCLFD